MKKSLLFILLFFNYQFNFGAIIIENVGQIKNDSVKYYSSIANWKVFFLKDKISFVSTKLIKSENRNNDTLESLRWDLCLGKEFQIIGEKKASENLNFISGANSFCSNSFHQIRYISSELEIVFYNHPLKGLKYDIISRPKNSGLNSIIFSLKGVEQLLPSENGIEIKTLLGDFILEIPSAYADIKNGNSTSRKNIEIKESILDKNLIYSFNFTNEMSAIIIDPWTSYIGGSDIEEIYGAAIDQNGNNFISGYTSSTDFPTTTGVIQQNFNGIYDSFVFKFDNNGQRVWSTYYGGTQNDFGNRIVVDNNNKVILTGYSYSSDLLVSTSGVFSSSFSGIFDAFVTRLNTDGTFDWGTFYGGSGGEFVSDIDIFNNEIIIGGFTSSMDLPVSGTAWQNSNNGGLDIFVAKFDLTGNRIWDTYFGGTNSEDAHTLTFDNSGNVILSGDTYSNDFPTSIGAYQDSYVAGSDMYLIKFNSAGQLQWATLLGGTGNDDCYGIDTDNNNNIYFSGYSTGNDLPVSVGAFQNSVAGDRDLIIGSFSSGGNLRWLTYAGGTAWDVATDVNVNAGGKVTITGESYSSNFPEVGSVFQSGNAGNSDIIYMICDSIGTVSFSSLLGGSSVDAGRALAFDQLYKMLITGNTSSSDFPITSGVFQTTYAGQGDGFAKTIDSLSGVFVNINENNLPVENYIYPNPSSEEIIITHLKNGNYQMEIYDLGGKLVSKKSIYSNGQIILNNEFESLKGIYFLQLKNEVSVNTYQIIRQ